MTNYDCYFGTQERALDSLSLLLEFPNHNRLEVREFQKEVREIGSIRWLKRECVNQRWWINNILFKTEVIDRNVIVKKINGDQEKILKILSENLQVQKVDL